VHGPFVPNYCKTRWADIFVEPLVGDMKLFGTTINTVGNPSVCSHVQSFVFSMDREALNYLIERQIFTRNIYCASMIQAVATREIIEKGWNTGCLLKPYEGVDFRTALSLPFAHDVCYPGNYYKQTTHPYEVVFVKSNRGQDLVWLNFYEKKNL
jgi:hypothetical protein